MMTERGKIHVNPYIDLQTFNFLIQFTWQELNLPRQKQPMAQVFADYVEKVGHRNHRGYQLTAGIPEFYRQLLDDSLNFKKRKRTLDLCRDWYTLFTSDMSAYRKQKRNVLKN
jgi:hypothetical protein